MKSKMSRMHKFTPVLFILGLACCLGRPVLALRVDGNAALDLRAVDEFLRTQVKANRIPGVAVAIVQDDQIIFSKGYGESAPGNAVTPQTQFYIGSVTKSFTALAALKLVEQGKLNLDSPVREYLPWFQVADPDASAKITVRNLLNHTSGLGDAGDPNAKAYTASLDEQARLLKNARLTAPVGSQFQYFNQNYRLVGLLIERVSGQSYGAYLQENIFAPLGMADTTADPQTANSLAQGYSRFFGFPLPQTQRFVPGSLPSGYLISTGDDMARFLLAQINNRQADGRAMLDPGLLAVMRTPPAGVQSEYGMGWMVLENGNMLAHGGVLEYFQAFVFLELKEKTGLVILFNQSGPENMLFENNTIRDGLLALLKGQSPSKISFGWIGWLLLAVFTADLLNHVRLFAGLPRWKQKTAAQNRKWLRSKVIAGILLPLFVIIGLPLSAAVVQGVSPDWLEPIRLVPDLTIWLLLGMSLLLVRSLLYAFALLRQPSR
jgi:CubicO group peptidase (beta-lactamase class C family)